MCSPLFLFGKSTDILQVRRQVNLPKPVGYERARKKDLEARQSLDSEHAFHAKSEYNTTRPSPTRSHAPNRRVETAVFAPTRLPDSSVTKNARTQPAVPHINPCDRVCDSNKNIGSEIWQLNSVPKPENKTVRWEGISASISSSHGFQIWAEKLAMLNGEVKSGFGSSPIPPVKQKERKASTARGPGVAVPRFLESPQTKN